MAEAPSAAPAAGSAPLSGSCRPLSTAPPALGPGARGQALMRQGGVAAADGGGVCSPLRGAAKCSRVGDVRRGGDSSSIALREAASDVSAVRMEGPGPSRSSSILGWPAGG